MTALIDTWVLLEAEINSVIEGITPNSWATTPFKARTVDDRKATPSIESVTGRNRLFQINPPTPTLPDMTIGSTTRHKELRYTLQIIYDGSYLWDQRAMDDADLIAQTFRKRSWTTANVAFVDPDLEFPATMTPVGEHGEYHVLTIGLYSPLAIS